MTTRPRFGELRLYIVEFGVQPANDPLVTGLKRAQLSLYRRQIKLLLRQFGLEHCEICALFHQLPLFGRLVAYEWVVQR
jgi:hypothetical protein